MYSGFDIDHETKNVLSLLSEYTTKSYIADKAFSDPGYTVSPKVTAIQQEIMTFGPVEATFIVYADFATYKSGVYKVICLAFSHLLRYLADFKSFKSILLIKKWSVYVSSSMLIGNGRI